MTKATIVDLHLNNSFAMHAVDDQVLDQAFRQARTYNVFRPVDVSDSTLKALYDLLKWGPTSMNCQPARYIFLRSEQAKLRAKPALSASNMEKTMAAPVVAIVALDTRFYEHITEQFPAYDARGLFEGSPALAQATAQRNGTLQGAYLMIAARLLGLDCGPMSGFDAAALNAAFFPDGRFQTNFIVNLGYGDPSGNHPRGPRLPFEAAVQVL